MNVNQARILDVLSHAPSLSEAAAEMGTSQPRLTQQLRAVEAELGAELFHRSPRGLVISDAGKLFLPYARQLVRTFQEAQEALSSLSEGTANRLRLGASVTTSHQLVPDNLLAFHRRFPKVLVTVSRALPKDLVKGLEEGRFDLCFGLELPESVLFTREVVFKTNLVGLSAVSAKPAAKATLEKFCAKPLVLAPRACDTRMFLDDALRRVGVKPFVVLEADDMTTVLTIVRSGEANTVVPRTLVPASKNLATTMLTDLSIDVQGTILYPKTPTSEARNFIRMIQDRVGASSLPRN